MHNLVGNYAFSTLAVDGPLVMHLVMHIDHVSSFTRPNLSTEMCTCGQR
jgi:hypothetical protein